MDVELKENLDPQRQLKRGRRLLKHVWTHFQEDRCLAEAASLGYTSLLSLIPLLAVVFGIVAAFPMFSELSDKLQDFIFANFMPATGEQIVPYIDRFLESVGNLTLPGMISLIVTALLLLNRIEAAFNLIWRVEKGRTLVNRVVMYWAVLTLVPLLMSAAVAFSAQKVMGMVGGDAGIPPGLYRLGMFIVAWMVIAAVFLLVPNRRVQFKHALIGAFLSAILFELAKAGFVGYVSNANYTVIYGALATIPLFLMWIYIVWTVILFGASLAASLTTFSDYSRYETRWPDRWEFQLAFRLLGHFREAQKRGEALSREQLLELEPQASELQLLKLTGRMRDEKILSMVDDDLWLLARDLEDLTLAELYRCGDYYLPLGETDRLPRDTAWDDAFVDSLESIASKAGSVWKKSLRQMYLDYNEEESGDEKSSD
jgi:membrane protein